MSALSLSTLGIGARQPSIAAPAVLACSRAAACLRRAPYITTPVRFFSEGKAKTLPEAIRADHEALRNLFSRYKASPDESEKRSLLNQYIREIIQHSTAEELVLYPALLSLSSKSASASASASASQETASRLEAERTAHHRMKEALGSVNRLLISGNEVTNPEGFGFSPDVQQKVEEAMVDFDRHMREEETGDLAVLVAEMPEEELVRLAGEFETRKMFVPTRPHPGVPESGGIAETVAAASA
ncbi:hypothetical protein M427DRAFT_151970, partial [Gonapodya prolifera JEL478]